MLITNDFTDNYSLRSDLKDVVEGTAPFKVRTRRPGQKRVRTRYIQPRELQETFYGLIADWRQTGPNLNRFFEKHPELKDRMTLGRTVLFIGQDGSGHLTWSPIMSPSRTDGTNEGYDSNDEHALQLFIRFITSPLQDSLAGPCEHEKCRRLFLKTSKHDKKYCSKRCSAAVTAMPSITKRRLEIRREKIALAQEAIKKWKAQSRRNSDWKRWVQRSTGTQKRFELRLTMQWLTRTVNKGQLTDLSNGDKLL